MVENFCAEAAPAVNVLARHVGARVVVADLGVASRSMADGNGARPAPRGGGDPQHHAGPGDDPRRGAAGDRGGRRAGRRGAAPDCVGTGEMGIGNTTAASALTAALTGADPR